MLLRKAMLRQAQDIRVSTEFPDDDAEVPTQCYFRTAGKTYNTIWE